MTQELVQTLTFAVLVAVATGYSHTAGQLTARSCASAATTVVGATFPCLRRLRSQSYQSVLLAVHAIRSTQIQDILLEKVVAVKLYFDIHQIELGNIYSLLAATPLFPRNCHAPITTTCREGRCSTSVARCGKHASRSNNGEKAAFTN